MRVALYTRLSPNPDKADTINQERELENFVKKQEGWRITKVYKDIHISGNKEGKDRPQFTEMMKDAEKRKFDLLFFWSIDRFSREGLLPTLQYLDKLAKFGVDYKSYLETYLDSRGEFNDIFLSISSTLARLERRKLIERTKVGLATAIANGKTLGRPVATRQTDKREVPVDLDLARQMRMQGKSLREIGKHFNAGASTIYRMLR